MRQFSLLRHGSVYAAGDVFERLIGLVMLPVYAYSLSPAEFGLLALVQVLTGLGSAFLAMGIYAAVMRFYYNAPSGHTGPRVIAAAWPLLLGVPLLIESSLALSGEPLFRSIMASLDFQTFVLPALAITYLNVAFVEFYLAVSRTRREPRRYVAVLLTRASLTAGLSAFMLLARDGGAADVVMAQLIATLTVACVCAGSLWRIGAPAIDGTLARGLLRFGLPLLPLSTSTWALRLQDRLILDRMSGTGDVGVYAMSARLAMPLQVLLEAAFRVIEPTLSAASDSEVERNRARQFVVQYIVGGSALLVASVTVAPQALEVLLPPAYAETTRVIQLLLISVFSLGVFRLSNATSLFYAGKVRSVLALTVCGVTLNLVLNIILIPQLQVVGVALASATTFVLLAAVAWTTGPLRELRIPAHHAAACRGAGCGSLLLLGGPHSRRPCHGPHSRGAARDRILRTLDDSHYSSSLCRVDDAQFATAAVGSRDRRHVQSPRRSRAVMPGCVGPVARSQDTGGGRQQRPSRWPGLVAQPHRPRPHRPRGRRPWRKSRPRRWAPLRYGICPVPRGRR